MALRNHKPLIILLCRIADANCALEYYCVYMSGIMVGIKVS